MSSRHDLPRAATADPAPFRPGGTPARQVRARETPRLSVVVPTRDTRDLTLACVRSVARSPIPPLEVIVVDDGSTDGTAQAVQAELEQLRVLPAPPPPGFSRAANVGAAAAQGDVLVFLNSDTELTEQGLRPVVEAFAKDPGLGVAGAALRFPDGREQWSGGPTPSPLWAFLLASHLPRVLSVLPLYRRLHPLAEGRRRIDWVSGAALAIRREAWEQIGPFPTGGGNHYCQDLEICLRSRRAGWSVALLPEWRVVHHQGGTVATLATQDRAWRGEGRLWRDLVDWAGRWGGPGRARRLRRALVAGGRLRLAALRLAALLPRKPSRDRSHRRRLLEGLERDLASLTGDP